MRACCVSECKEHAINFLKMSNVVLTGYND